VLLTFARSWQPYEYYLLPFCQPEVLETVAENLGEVLRGDKIMNSLYELKMGVEETCKILCRKELTNAEAKEFAVRVEEDYRVHWVMDNLPSATKVHAQLHPRHRAAIAAPLGVRCLPLLAHLPARLLCFGAVRRRDQPGQAGHDL
jgi:transmembrane 9 superfamily protein 2/4